MNIQVKTKGVKQLEAKLTVLQAKLSTDQPGSALRQAMQRSVYRLQIGMATYPTRTSKWYRRTGTLGRRWTTKIDTGGGRMVGRVGNNTAYAPFVQSDQYQRSFLRGWWQTDRQVMQREAPAILRDFQNTVGNAVTVAFRVNVGGL